MEAIPIPHILIGSLHSDGEEGSTAILFVLHFVKLEKLAYFGRC